MFSPYEELEYLANFLPEEGEAVLVVREKGELICKPWSQGSLRDGIDDADLYGQLVQVNERLNLTSALPLWVGALGMVWLAIGVHGWLGLGWSHWYVIPGMVPLALFGCFQWIRWRQRRTFEQELPRLLQGEMKRLQVSPYALIAGVRQHAELRTLLDELVRWSPEEAQVVPGRRVEDTPC